MKTHRLHVALLVVASILLFLVPQLSAKDRSEIDAKYKWDLTVLYPTVQDFNKAKAEFLPAAEKLAGFKGKMGKSAATLKDTLDLYNSLEEKMRRMEAYTMQTVDQDARVSENKAAKSEVDTIRTKFNGLASFIEPEIIAIDSVKLEKYLKTTPGLKIYKFPISEVIRRKAHILSQKEEKIMAASNDLAGSSESIFNVFTNADLPQETITLADGTKLEMDYANYDKVRQSLVEEDRIKAFKAFLGQHDRFKRTLAEVLYSQMKVHRFNANVRGYASTLAAAMNYDGIDTKIYESLIAAAHQNFPTFHRYLKLKARALGKTRLDYTDMYVPFSREVKMPVNYEQGRRMIIEAFAPMGPDYVGHTKEAFDSGWIDAFPNDGKESGGYMNGWAYGVHPYILVNFNDTYSQTLTLAHELGHAMHSYYSSKYQPFVTSNYSTFMAEVASTFNENLLNDYVLKSMKSDEERMYLLGHLLDELLKATFFRQIQFAEFELMIHQKVEKGEALTDQILNKLYLDLARQYYGHEQGVVNVPEFLAVEWAIIPHFYYNYYVYQYSTSVAAASLIFQKITHGEAGALDNYYTHLLKAGGSDNPVKLLQGAGADMTRPEAYAALMQRANGYMDEIEKFLDQKKGQ